MREVAIGLLVAALLMLIAHLIFGWAWAGFGGVIASGFGLIFAGLSGDRVDR